MAEMPASGASSSTQSLATSISHTSDSPCSPVMDADQVVDPRTVPLPGDETDAFVAVGLRGRPVKKPVSYTHLDVYKRQAMYLVRTVDR